MVMLVVYRKNGQKVTTSDIRVSMSADEREQESLSLRGGWSKYNDYMNRQIDLILDTDWANEFQKQALSFGKVDAAYLIRKSFGALRSVG